MKIFKILCCAFVGMVIATLVTVGAWHVQIEPRAFQCWDSVGLFDTYWQDIDEHKAAGDKISPGWTWDEIKTAREIYIWAFLGVWVSFSAAVSFVIMRNGGQFWAAGVEKGVACLFLVTMLPMFLLIAFLIRSTGGGSAFVCDEVLNHEGRMARRLRFRTAGPGTAFFRGMGRLLRKYSIDELPALWSVVRGDISLKEMTSIRS